MTRKRFAVAHLEGEWIVMVRDHTTGQWRQLWSPFNNERDAGLLAHNLQVEAEHKDPVRLVPRQVPSEERVTRPDIRPGDAVSTCPIGAEPLKPEEFVSGAFARRKQRQRFPI